MIFPKKIDPKKCPCCTGVKPLVDFGNGSVSDYDLSLYIYQSRGRSHAHPLKGYGNEILPCDNGQMHLYPDQTSNAYGLPSSFVPSHEFGHTLGLCHPGQEKTSYRVRVVIGNQTVQAPYAYEGKDMKERPVNGKEDLMGVGMGLRDFYFDRWQEDMNGKCPNCDYKIKKTMHLASFILIFILFNFCIFNLANANNVPLSPVLKLMSNTQLETETNEGILLPPMNEDNQNSKQYVSVDHLSSIPRQRNFEKLTSVQASKFIPVVDSQWIDFVTFNKSFPGIYTEFIFPPILCKKSKIILNADEHIPYTSQWCITCIRNKKEFGLNLFFTKNEEPYIKIKNEVIPCFMWKGKIKNGGATISFGFNDMQKWFKFYENGRDLLFICYQINNWYGILYFSIKNSDIYYHGSEYISEEAAASM